MLILRHKQAGFSMIELMVVIAVLGVLTAMAMPAMSNWARNSRIRLVADAIQNGLQLARSQAQQNNSMVRFQLTTTLNGACAITTANSNWVVSLDDPSGACGGAKLNMGFAADDAANNPAPRIIQERASAESSDVTVTSAEVGAATHVYAGQITFNGLGRVVPTSIAAGDSVNIDVTNTAGGACIANGGPMKCLRVVVSSAGQIRMCNPALPATNPAGC